MSLLKYDKRIQRFKNNLNKYPSGIAKKVETFLNHTLLGIHVRSCMNGKPEAAYEMLDLLENSNLNLNKQFVTDTLIKDQYEKLAANSVFQEVKGPLFGIKQKGFGAGELLLNFLISDMKLSESKKGDGVVSGKHLEIKSGTSASSIKAHPKTNHQPSNKLWIDIYGGHKKGQTNKQIWNGTKEQFHFFCSQLYTHFYDKEKFDEIWNQPTIKDKEQLLGYNILLAYVDIDDIGILTLLAPEKDDIKMVCINDFSDRKFILDNIHFKPVMHRGKGTQALADGYCDIKFKGGK